MSAPTEEEMIARIFAALLALPTADGKRKRERGEKPPWWIDGAHQAAIFSHLSKWKHGQLADPESRVHPLVHLAWRALALGWQEMTGCARPTPEALTALLEKITGHSRPTYIPPWKPEKADLTVELSCMGREVSPYRWVACNRPRMPGAVVCEECYNYNEQRRL